MNSAAQTQQNRSLCFYAHKSYQSVCYGYSRGKRCRPLVSASVNIQCNCFFILAFSQLFSEVETLKTEVVGSGPNQNGLWTIMREFQVDATRHTITLDRVIVIGNNMKYMSENCPVITNRNEYFTFNLADDVAVSHLYRS